jgi:hypothetical protein
MSIIVNKVKKRKAMVVNERERIKKDPHILGCIINPNMKFIGMPESSNVHCPVSRIRQRRLRPVLKLT